MGAERVPALPVEELVPKLVQQTALVGIGQELRLEAIKRVLRLRELADEFVIGWKAFDGPNLQSRFRVVEVSHESFKRLPEFLRGVMEVVRIRLVDSKVAIGLLQNCGLTPRQRRRLSSVERHFAPGFEQVPSTRHGVANEFRSKHVHRTKDVVDHARRRRAELRVDQRARFSQFKVLPAGSELVFIEFFRIEFHP